MERLYAKPNTNYKQLPELDITPNLGELDQRFVPAI